MSQELIAKYQQQKADFLDSLQPDDFRNGGSFNQAEFIMALSQTQPQKFI